MKKRFVYALALVMGMFSSVAMTSCDDDDDNNSTQSADEIIAAIDAADNLEYNASNATNWKAYMQTVASLLSADASKLYDEWNNSYANEFKTAGATTNKTFTSTQAATQQIVAGCVDIANEVGAAKIGEPVDLWKKGKYEEAVYAVESWYSFHSRVDYSNNILSIKNAYYGSTDGTIATHSLANGIKAVNADLDARVQKAIANAVDAILAIPQPFRSHLYSAEAEVAASACADLKILLDGEVMAAVAKIPVADQAEINKNFVDVVVMPTYEKLKAANAQLLADAMAFDGTSFATICADWVKAREYWETSEAFLFGPVADLGLDPNMDSWPLDRTAIANIISNGDFSGMTWTGDYNEEDENIASAQSIRGFHTLEYLIFKQGNPRSIN